MRDTQKFCQSSPLVGYSISDKLLLCNDFRWDMSQKKTLVNYCQRWLLPSLVAVIKLALINLKYIFNNKSNGVMCSIGWGGVEWAGT